MREKLFDTIKTPLGQIFGFEHESTKIFNKRVCAVKAINVVETQLKSNDTEKVGLRIDLLRKRISTAKKLQ